MVLDFFPLDYMKVNDFFNEAVNKAEIIEKEQKIFDLFDIRFCKYIDRYGKLCGRKSRNVIENNCCKQHIKFVYKDKDDMEKMEKTYYIKKEIIYKCIWKNKYNLSCKRNVLTEGDLCCFHKKFNELKLDNSITISPDKFESKNKFKDLNSLDQSMLPSKSKQKYCNFERSQNRGSCKNIIYQHEISCYAHPQILMKMK